MKADEYALECLKQLKEYCKAVRCNDCVFLQAVTDGKCGLAKWDIDQIKALENGKPNYWLNICEMRQKQVEKGIETYGQTLEDNKALNIVERITMLEEELIDGLMYAEHIKQWLKEIEDGKE